MAGPPLTTSSTPPAVGGPGGLATFLVFAFLEDTRVVGRSRHQMTRSATQKENRASDVIMCCAIAVDAPSTIPRPRALG